MHEIPATVILSKKIHVSVCLSAVGLTLQMHLVLMLLMLLGTATAATVSPTCPDPANCTSGIQSLLSNASVSTVLFRLQDSPYITLPLLLSRPNVQLVCEPGVTLLALRWAFNSTGASLLTIQSPASNISLDGCTLRMWRSDYVNPKWYRTGEWRMALNLEAVQGITITNAVLEESGGDGLYVGGVCCRDVFISNVVSRNNYRQGISVICADGLVVQDSVFTGTRGTAPECGVDIEPDLPTQQVTNVLFQRNVFSNNSGCGIAVSVYALTNVTQPFSFSFVDNAVLGTEGYGVIWNIPHAHDTSAASAASESARESQQQQVVFANNTIRNCASFAFFIFSSNFSKAHEVAFESILVENASYSTTGDNIAAIVLDLPSLGHLVFGPQFVVNNSNDRLLVYSQGSPPIGDGNLSTVSGTIHSAAPTGRGCIVENHMFLRNLSVVCHVAPPW